jgi:hypothetical protein
MKSFTTAIYRRGKAAEKCRRFATAKCRAFGAESCHG